MRMLLAIAILLLSLFVYAFTYARYVFNLSAITALRLANASAIVAAIITCIAYLIVIEALDGRG